ncbi:MAG: hypothetical protein KF773_07075 [Deltaproteobacteria bacterium]|nr:hypothetical protein [Deltaproteobacteria bacterium]MCW5802203.1 hypothetical protein [Deltaproteobacteria bacterium]
MTRAIAVIVTLAVSVCLAVGDAHRVAADNTERLHRYDPKTTALGPDASTYTGAKPYLSARGQAGSRWRPERWVALTKPTRIDRGRLVIAIGADAGEFHQLRLFNNTGSSRIEQLVIELADGSTQRFALARTLTSADPITVDLAGGYRRIARVVVHGSTAPDSAYQLLGK